MCGVFGFVAAGDGRLDLVNLKRIAKATESRGPHAFGFAWVDRRGRLRSFKQTGRISDSLAVLAMAADARMLIGHCRWATHGDCHQNVNNHPHPADGGWIVHNGTLPDYKRVIDKHELLPVTECDSEVLGLLIETLSGSLSDRCAKAVETAAPSDMGRDLFSRSQPLVMIGLWARPARMIVIRRGNPLHFSAAREGAYLASLPADMPGKPVAVKDGSVHTFMEGRPCRYASLVPVGR